MPTKEIVDTNHDVLFKAAAQIIVQRIAASSGKQFNLALCGGRSIQPLLAALSGLRTSGGGELWKSVNFFLVDERLVPLGHPDCNFTLVQTQLLNQLVADGLISESQFHPFILDPQREDRGTTAYSEDLKRLGNRFDFAVVGVGEDAHVGALFPNHHSVKDERDGFIWFADSPKPPPERMTASRQLIVRSSSAIGIVTGEGKRQALQTYRTASVPPEGCPLKLLNQIADSFIITDLV